MIGDDCGRHHVYSWCRCCRFGSANGRLKRKLFKWYFDIFKILGTYFHIPAAMMVRLVGIILFVGSLGSLALWTAAPVKVFFSEIPDGLR